MSISASGLRKPNQWEVPPAPLQVSSLKNNTRKAWCPVKRNHVKQGHVHPTERATGCWASHESHPPWGAVPRTGGHSAAPRASTHYMPAAPPLWMVTSQSPQTWPMSGMGVGGLPRLRTTGLNQYNTGHQRHNGALQSTYLRIFKVCEYY